MTTYLGVDPGYRYFTFVEDEHGNIINHYILDLCPNGYNKNKHTTAYLLTELAAFMKSSKAPKWLQPDKVFKRVGIENQMKSKLKSMAALLFGMYSLKNTVSLIHPRTYKPRMVNGHANNKKDARDYLKLKQPNFVCMNVNKTDDVADGYMLAEYLRNLCEQCKQ